jgi:hypothetical protein
MFDEEPKQYVRCSCCNALMSIYVANPVLSEYYCNSCKDVDGEDWTKNPSLFMEPLPRPD